MSRPLFTASATARIVKCRFSAQIGRDWNREPVGAAAHQGTLIHAIVDNLIRSHFHSLEPESAESFLTNEGGIDSSVVDVNNAKLRARILADYAIERIGEVTT